MTTENQPVFVVQSPTPLAFLTYEKIIRACMKPLLETRQIATLWIFMANDSILKKAKRLNKFVSNLTCGSCRNINLMFKGSLKMQKQMNMNIKISASQTLSMHRCIKKRVMKKPTSIFATKLALQILSHSTLLTMCSSKQKQNLDT